MGAAADSPTVEPSAPAAGAADATGERAPAAPDAATARGTRRHRGAALLWLAALVLLAGAFAVRLAYVDATPGMKLVHDALDYDGHAVSIAQGEGYSDTLAHGRPTAFRPPGYPYLLGAAYKLAGVEHEAARERVRVARVTGVVIGTVLVAMIGLLALQLWGPAVALVAIGLGGVYVPLITMSGAVMSEPLFAVFMLASLTAAIAHRRSAHRYRWALLAGLLAGASILTRANAIILLVPLAAAVWDVRPRFSIRALGPPAALVAVAILAIVPWTIRNARTLHAFVPVSTQLGSAMGGTYNDEARTDRYHPASWRSLKSVRSYGDLYAKVGRTNEATLEAEVRHRAQRYALHHPLYVAQVAFWTTVRGLDLDGLDWARHTAGTVSIEPAWARRGVYCFWVVAALALAGAFTRLARRTPWFVWAFPALMYLSVVFLVIETPRYRTPMDPFIVLLAALALVAAGRRAARQA